MPKLGVIKTRKLQLPSSTVDDPAWIEVKDQLLMGDVADLSNADTDIDKTFIGLASFIAEWNFTENGEPVSENNPALPITPDAMRHFTQNDFEFVAEEFQKSMTGAQAGLSNVEKKSSLSTSIEVQMGETQTPADSQTTIQHIAT